MLLKCTNLSFRYPESTQPVIDGLSFAMEAPGFNALFGPSGVGKTSFARLVSGGGLPGESAVETRGIRTILYTYNQERLPGWSGTGSHLTRVTPPGRQELKQRLVDIFGIADVIDSRFARLSMGQQNRANLIRYLLQDFDLLIMDESLANVDEKQRETILLAIKDLFPERLFLYISHNLMEVAKFCREILVFSDPAARKGYSLIRGQDLGTGGTLDRKGLDATLLEIMNAF
jgi:multiple sugar transport system ATP-binding protein